MCTFETNFAGDYVLDNRGGVENASGGLAPPPRRLHCPVISSFTYRQEAITGIEVYYNDRNATADVSSDVQVQVCNQSLSETPACSTMAVSSVEGRSVVLAHPSAITLLQTKASGFFSEVLVDIPKPGPSGRSKILGIGFRYSRTF